MSKKHLECDGVAAAPQDIPLFSTGKRILFQGDSITDGNWMRDLDLNHILGHGYVFIIGAKFGAAYPERKLTFMNRGWSGHQVKDLLGRWQTDAIDLRPDVLSLLIGINDYNSGVPAEDFEAQCDRLLAWTVKDLPEVRLVLCEPFALPAGGYAETWEHTRTELGKRQEAVRRLAEKYCAAFVGFQRVFDAACERAPANYWIWDGVHPTVAGHQLMADEWVRTVA